jgi:hypothetical protein
MTDLMTVARHEAAHMVVALAVGSTKVQGWLEEGDEELPEMSEEDLVTMIKQDHSVLTGRQPFGGAGASTHDNDGLTDEDEIVIGLAPEIYDEIYYEDHEEVTVGQLMEMSSEEEIMAEVNKRIRMEDESRERSLGDHVDIDNILEKFHKKAPKIYTQTRKGQSRGDIVQIR